MKRKDNKMNIIWKVTARFYNGDTDQETIISKPSPVDPSMEHPNFEKYMDTIQLVVDKYENSNFDIDSTIDQSGDNTEFKFNFPTMVYTSEVTIITKVANDLLDDIILALTQVKWKENTENLIL